MQAKYEGIKNVSVHLEDLIKKMLVPDYKRLTMTEIYDHPWIKGSSVGSNLSFCFEEVMMSAEYYRSELELIMLLVNIFSVKMLVSL